MKSPGKRSRKVANFLQRLAHTGDGVFAVDPDHHITLWNQAAESLLGYSDEEVLGKNCHDVIQGRDCNGLVICSKQCSHFEVAKSLRTVEERNGCLDQRHNPLYSFSATEALHVGPLLPECRRDHCPSRARKR